MGSGVSSITQSESANIVIVGGGYGGSTLGRKLKSTGKIKIINPYDFLFHNIGALRAAVEPKFAKKIMIPLKPTFGDSFIKGRVVKIDKERSTIILESGDEIKYSHLILATGTSSAFPAKLTNNYPNANEEEAQQLYDDIDKQILEAETIVCVGGGPVGIELAGELKTDFPKKKVILIHPNQTLASARMKAKVQKSLHQVLTRKGIELMLDERVSNLGDLQLNKCVKDQVVKTESGKEVKCDLVFRCTGGKPNTEAFKEALGDSLLENGLIKVDQFLRVSGSENIFALGDITDIDEEKMAVNAAAHAELIAKNINASISGKKMQPYKPSNFVMLVPVGRNGGVGQLAGIAVGDAITKNIKSSGLFVKRFWGEMGQKSPK